MNTKNQSAKFPSCLNSRESVHTTNVATQKISPSTKYDNPVLLGKCHFRVTISVISKCDKRPESKLHDPQEGK
ncbi:MAG: hypothetical protein JWM04_1407 [Verrucomicrobiales bacterium]|nr:hypothetical protein [Verrucomicrobiales bacterium]